jgi:putative nucleotidyltransferase with HDIG domain
MLSVGLLTFFEQVFKVTSEITLLELTDFNHPLLRRMQVEAPGTYHHSLMVANLAENAAAKIGASPLLCRAACLYHDIGKLIKPDYFTENQNSGINPHDEQTPSISALVIKAHIKEGIELARNHNLPRILIDVIRQHHGTSLIQYFYFLAQKKEAVQASNPQNEHSKSNGSNNEHNKVDESTYRYDGPKPDFKESAIIFFADSVEAASRSLKKVTQPAVEDLIESIFRAKIEDGQLDKCPLTFKELQQIRSSFARTLLNMLHARIEYPKANESSPDTTANPQPVETTQKASEIDDSTRTQQPI